MGEGRRETGEVRVESGEGRGNIPLKRNVCQDYQCKADYM